MFHFVDFSQDNNNDSNTVTYQYKPKNLNDLPWIEKYRPNKLEDLIINKNVYNTIQTMINNKEMQNILITGASGIGKTSTILCIAKHLFGKHINKGMIELNASNDRGIKTIHETVKTFCKKKLDLNDSNIKIYSEQKIVLLDESDNMTSKAQHLVSELMEQYNKTTRFAFTCNDSSKIIESIQSRCLILHYTRIDQSQMIDRLETICKNENISYNIDSLKTIAVMSNGDMRNAINNLQLVHNAFMDITIININKICDKPQPVVLKQILLECYKHNIGDAMILIKTLINKGFSTSDIILGMASVLKSDIIPELHENTRINFYTIIAKTIFNTSKIDSEIQLTGCIAKLCS